MRVRAALEMGCRPNPPVSKARASGTTETPNPLFFIHKEGRVWEGLPPDGVRGWPRSRSDLTRGNA